MVDTKFGAFGWNFLSTVIFSQGPLGKQLLVINGGQKLGEVLSTLVFIFQLLAVPIVTYCYLNLLSKKQKNAIDTETTTANIGIANSGA